MKLFFQQNKFVTNLSNLLFYKKKKELTFDKIVIFDFHGIGDLVLLIPFLKTLRENFPTGTIVLVAQPQAEAILRNTNYVNEIIPYQAPWVKRKALLKMVSEMVQLIRRLRGLHLNVGIEMRGDLRQIFLLWLTGVDSIVGYSFTGGKRLLTVEVPDDGKIKHLLTHHRQILQVLLQKEIPPDQFVPEIILSEDEKRNVIGWRQIQGRKRIGIHPFASFSLKQWPPDKIKALVKILERKYQVILFFGPGDLFFQEQILPEPTMHTEISNTDLRELILKIASLDCLIAMDSGAGHLAAALNIPVISIFGPTQDFYSKPIGNKEVWVVNLSDEQIPCRPCDQIHCTNEIHQKCLTMIEVAQVLEKLETLEFPS